MTLHTAVEVTTNKKSAGFRILLTVVLLPFFLLPAELLVKYIRTPGPARRDTIAGSYMPIRLRPNFRGPIGDIQEVITNRYGFRGESDFPRRRPDGEYRILALGDSIGFGFGVQPEETYSRQAEALLLGGPKRNRIINAAGQGYSPSTYLAYLQAEGFDLEPNLILVQVEPSNDVTDEALLRVVDGADHGLEVRGGRYCVTWDGNLLGSFTMGPYFYERTYLYTMLTRRLLETLGRLFPRHSALSAPGNLYYHMGFDRFLFTSARLESGWTQSQAALSQIRELAGRRGSSLVLLLTPTLYAFHENRTLNGFGNLLIDRMTDWARQESIDYIDPRAALAENGGTALFTDFAHYTPEGHWVLGREIARHLRDNEWKMED